MRRYFDTVRTIVERHGGTVEKFIGDAAMAVFGIPQQHEDDALRAVRAADELRQAITGLNTDLEQGHGVAIQIRTAINTGEVVAGDSASSGQPFATGSALNIAMRLHEAALPAEILLGRRHTASCRRPQRPSRSSRSSWAARSAAWQPTGSSPSHGDRWAPASS